MRRVVILYLFGSLLTATAYGHRDDYINETFVFRTLDRHELELEYWFDYHHLNQSNRGYYQHTASVEFGFTDYWMADVALNFSDQLRRSDYGLTRLRFETRRRFGEEGEHVIDFASSMELEAEKDVDRWNYQLTPRAVLSKDFATKLNTTLNLFVGIGTGDKTTLNPGYNFGIRYPSEGILRVGGELIQQWDEHQRTSGLIIPQLWILPRPEDVIKIGYAKAFGSEENYFLRVAIEIGL